MHENTHLESQLVLVVHCVRQQECCLRQTWETCQQADANILSPSCILIRICIRKECLHCVKVSQKLTHLMVAMYQVGRGCMLKRLPTKKIPVPERPQRCCFKTIPWPGSSRTDFRDTHLPVVVLGAAFRSMAFDADLWSHCYRIWWTDLPKLFSKMGGVGGEQEDKRLQSSFGWLPLPLLGSVHKLHHASDGGVESQLLCVLCHLHPICLSPIEQCI